jgi:hypothetical protein
MTILSSSTSSTKRQKRAIFSEYVSFTDDYTEKLRGLIQERWYDIWKQLTKE